MGHEADTLTRFSWRSGCAATPGIGLTASGSAGALAGVASTATLAVGLAFLDDTRRTGAFFGAFFLIALVFLTAVAFLRLATLLTSVFLRFALPLRLALVLVANTASLELTTILKPTARWLPNKMAIQRARRPADPQSHGSRHPPSYLRR